VCLAFNDMPTDVLRLKALKALGGSVLAAWHPSTPLSASVDVGAGAGAGTDSAAARKRKSLRLVGSDDKVPESPFSELEDVPMAVGAGAGGGGGTGAGSEGVEVEGLDPSPSPSSAPAIVTPPHRREILEVEVGAGAGAGAGTPTAAASSFSSFSAFLVSTYLASPTPSPSPSPSSSSSSLLMLSTADALFSPWPNRKRPRAVSPPPREAVSTASTSLSRFAPAGTSSSSPRGRAPRPLRVVAVSNKQGVASGRAFEHRETDFRTSRGFLACLTDRTVCIALDYFWVASTYYRDRYGLDWVREKVRAAFARCPKLRCILLPVDRFGGAMRAMLEEDDDVRRLYEGGITWRFMSAAESRACHPLVRATAAAADDLRGQGREKESAQLEAQWRYVDDDCPFVAFERAETV
jgi:hypothetical protein